VRLTRERRRLGIWLARWLALAALWLGLSDSRATPELIAAGGAGLAGTVLASLIARPGPPRTLSASARLVLGAPGLLVRPVLRLVPDTVILARELPRLARGRPSRGGFRLERASRSGAAASSAGRVACEIWGSLAPNRYVVGMDRRTGELFLHELAGPGPGSG